MVRVFLGLLLLSCSEVAFSMSYPDCPCQDIDSMIFNAMKDELNRCSENLVDADGVKPLFIDYHIRRQATTHITSSLGTCFRYEPVGVKNSGLVSVITGDRMHTSYNMKNAGKPFNLPNEVSYRHIRMELGAHTEKQFRDVSARKARRREQSFVDADLPEWPKQPGGTIIQESALTHWMEDAVWLKNLADTLSAVFKSYPELSETQVEIEQSYSDCYRMTSEDFRARMPLKKIVVSVFANAMVPDGMMIKRRDAITAYDVADLPPMDSLLAFAERFAKLTICLSNAECPEEREYTGPVLYQHSAAMQALVDEISIHDNMSTYIHSWLRLDAKEYDGSYRKIGQKVISNKISLWQSGNDSLFDGRRLLRYRKYDADGVRPQTVNLIRNGVLQTQLAGRIPSPGATASTGNEFLMEKWYTKGALPTTFGNGVLRISCKKKMDQDKMVKQLRKLAKQQGLEYAYILKGKGVLARISTETGKVELLRLCCFDTPSKLELMRDVSASKSMAADPERSIIYPQSILLPMAKLVFKPMDSYPTCEKPLRLHP